MPRITHLLLLSEDGRTDPLTANDLAVLIRGSVKLAILNACHTADVAPDASLGAMAPQLVLGGLPAVIGMQFKIPHQTAVAFSQTLYQCLAAGHPLDLAVTKARQALYFNEKYKVDWAIPVLFMRAPDGMLWQTLDAYLHPGRRDFYKHINLPLNYVSRLELLDELRQSLLVEPDSLALASAIPMSTIHGMGGIGKSVMARALCEDPIVQAAFPDGILWATVGQEPDLVARLREWIECLGGDISQTAPTVDQLKVALADLLAERACLLIADDVWQKEHAAVFRAGGPYCRLLLTTRDAAIARELGAAVLKVPQMTQTEAVALLRKWAQGALDGYEEMFPRQIVKRLGYLPLAIKLAGPQLERKEPQAWLAAFDARRLQARRRETVQDSLVLTFNLSLNSLSTLDRKLYAALSIFKEEEATPVATIRRLWQALGDLEAGTTDDLLEDLADFALLELKQTEQGIAVTLHDLLRELMSKELGETGRVNAHRALLATYRQRGTARWGLARFMAACRALLTAYRRLPTEPGWATTPDDSYLLNHLAYHLNSVADYDKQAAAELHGLFADDMWLQKRILAADYLYDGYLVDLALAWGRVQNQAKAQITAAQPPSTLVDCLRYALIRTSVNSIASNYEPALVARAVEVGLWEPAHAFSIVQRIPNQEHKAKTLIALLATGKINTKETTVIQTRILHIAEQIGDEQRAKILGQLAPQVSDELLARLLQIAEQIEDGWWRANALGQLAHQLGGELLTQVLQAAEQMGKEEEKAWVLWHLSPKLSGEPLAQALQIAEHIEDDFWRAFTLGQLVMQLSGVPKESALTQAWQTTRQIRNEGKRAWVQGQLVSQFSGEAKKSVLTEVWQGLGQIEDEKWWADALGRLAPELSDELLTQAFHITVQLKDEEHRANALGQLAPRLRDDMLAQALQIGGQIKDEKHRANALVMLAPELKGKMLVQALKIARQIEDEGQRAWVLGRLAAQMSEKAKESVLTESLQALAQMRYERQRAWILGTLASQLSRELLEHALQIARRIGDERQQVWVLQQLATQLNGKARESTISKALQTAKQIRDDERRAGILGTLARSLWGKARESALTQALQAAEQISDERQRAEVLGRFAFRLRGKLLTKALEIVVRIENEENRANAFMELAPQLRGKAKKTALTKALQAAEQIEKDEQRARVFKELASQSRGKAKESALSKALQAAEQIEDDEQRAWILKELASQLRGKAEESTLTKALQAAEQIKDDRQRAWILKELASHLKGKAKESALTKALQAAEQIKDDWQRAWILGELATGKTKEATLSKALQAARQIGDKDNRAGALRMLALHFSGKTREATLSEALQEAKQIENEGRRVEVLLHLLPLMDNPIPERQLLQKTILDHIWKLQEQKREYLLDFLATKGLLSPDGLGVPSPAIEAVAQNVVEICQEWRWL